MSEELNVVEMIREKTEEADLNKYLKKSLGGYTKQSVTEYLNILRKQLQTSQETFSKNLNDLFIEKDKLKKDNESLLIRYNKLYAEYENLSQSLKDINLDDTNYSAEDYNLIRSNLIKIEEEIKKSDREKYALEKKVEHLQSNINELNSQLELSRQETKSQKELLKAERAESNKQREMVADLSCLLEVEKDEVEYIKKKLSDENFSQLNSTISQLTEQLKSKTEVIEKLNSENALMDSSIKTLNAEIKMLNENISNLTKTTDELNLQNNKLILVNENLTCKLEEEYKKSIDLIKEKSSITIEKLICESKLYDLESEKSSLSMKISKYEKLDDIKSINNDMLGLAVTEEWEYKDVV